MTFDQMSGLIVLVAIFAFAVSIIVFGLVLSCTREGQPKD